MGQHPEVALPFPGRPGAPAEGTPEPPLVPAEGGLHGPPLSVHPPVPAPLGLLPEPLHHRPPVGGLGPLPAPPPGVERDHRGPHPEFRPGVGVVGLGIVGGVGQHPIPGEGQGRPGQGRAELGGVVGRAGGDGRPGEEVAPGIAGDGELGPQPGRVLPTGPREEVPGRVPALQPGPIDGRGRRRADQAAVGCGRGGADEEDDDRPFFSSRAAA